MDDKNVSEEEILKFINDNEHLDLSLRDECSKEEDTFLHTAALSGFDRVAELLINKGIDVNAIDHYGRTPLHNALKEGNLKVCKILLAAESINLNIADNEGKTAEALLNEMNKDLNECFDIITKRNNNRDHAADAAVDYSNEKENGDNLKADKVNIVDEPKGSESPKNSLWQRLVNGVCNYKFTIGAAIVASCAIGFAIYKPEQAKKIIGDNVIDSMLNALKTASEKLGLNRQ